MDVNIRGVEMIDAGCVVAGWTDTWTDTINLRLLMQGLQCLTSSIDKGITLQCSPFISLCLGSIQMDLV